jgi:predicted transcriptional regulator
MIKEGAEYCSDIAKGLNRSKIEICRCTKKLQDMGFIKKEGQEYVLAEYGVVEITLPK